MRPMWREIPRGVARASARLGPHSIARQSPAMTILAWSKEFETGVDIVDRQHRELVDRINAAAPLLAASKNGKPANAAELLGALSDYVGVHFATEESLMREVGLD